MLMIITTIMVVLTILMCIITSKTKRLTKSAKEEVGRLKADVTYIKLYTLAHMPVLYVGDRSANVLTDSNLVDRVYK